MVRFQDVAAALAVGLCAWSPAAASGPPVSPDAAASVPAAASDRYEDEWSYRVRPWKRRPLTQITIESSGLGDDRREAAGEPQACTGFRPDERQVKVYLTAARRISQRDFLHEADWSACHATGSVRYRDGTVAQWMVQRYGAGYVVIGGHRHYLNCTDCALVGLDVGRR